MGCSVSLPVRKTRKDLVPVKTINNNEHVTRTSSGQRSMRCREKSTPRNWVNIVKSTQGGGSSRSRSAKSKGETTKLFVDQEFPANDSSIFKNKQLTKNVVWKRPSEIRPNPVLISDGTSRHDMKQGELNNCWFLSTLSAIAEKPELISKVYIIPSDNTFGTPYYDGKFHCRFWQFGKWVDVHIDDLLPTVNDEILFAHSSDPDEFWVSLVEKAYAKEGDCHQRRMLKFYIRSGLDKDGFQVKYISDFEGFGVFAKEQFKKGEFLLEYFGENISPEEAAVCSKKLDCNMIFLFYIKESNTDSDSDPFDLNESSLVEESYSDSLSSVVPLSELSTLSWLNKSYEALEYGFEADAFTDLTGGLAEWYNPAELKEHDFYLIRAAYQCGAVIGCLSVDKEDRDEREKRGMVSNHSYVITAVEEIPYKSGTTKLIRVRNPWGDTEWNGAWCDGSEEWDHVNNEVKDQLEILSRDDGEFWMNYDDFRREYCNMIVCNLSPDFDHDGISDRAEYQMSFKGSWKTSLNAGGWLECESFYQNPQYLITLHTDVVVQRRFNGRLPLIISLLQVYRRHEKLEGVGLFAIGFEIFQLYTKPTGALGKSFFDNNDPLMPENEETYAEYRETSGRFFLDPGQYILVPTTQLPNFQREYLMRVFSVCKMECIPIANSLPWSH